MKRQALDHPKMKILARRLNIPLAFANGLMERLWHFTAKYCPRGDIGRYGNDEIAIESGWEGDADVFLGALLVPGGFVEQHDTHRLVIHDWSEHADDSVHQLLKKKALTFWDGCLPYQRNGKSDREQTRTNANNRDETRMNANKPAQNESQRSMPEPEPEPEPFTLQGAPVEKKPKPRTEWETLIDELAATINARHPGISCGPIAVAKRLTTIAGNLSKIRGRYPDLTDKAKLLRFVDQNHAKWCDYWKVNGFPNSLAGWLAPSNFLYLSVPPTKAIAKPQIVQRDRAPTESERQAALDAEAAAMCISCGGNRHRCECTEAERAAAQLEIEVTVEAQRLMGVGR